MEKLTRRQNQVLRELVRYQAKFGFPPTLRELAEKFDLTSPTAVAGHLAALEKKGAIARRQQESRAIRLLRRGDVERVYKSQLKLAVD